jgi:hypothetical protein
MRNVYKVMYEHSHSNLSNETQTLHVSSVVVCTPQLRSLLAPPTAFVLTLNLNHTLLEVCPPPSPFLSNPGVKHDIQDRVCLPCGALDGHFRHLNRWDAIDPAMLLDCLQPRAYILRPVILRRTPVVENGRDGVWVKNHGEGGGWGFLRGLFTSFLPRPHKHGHCRAGMRHLSWRNELEIGRKARVLTTT